MSLELEVLFDALPTGLPESPEPEPEPEPDPDPDPDPAPAPLLVSVLPEVVLVVDELLGGVKEPPVG